MIEFLRTYGPGGDDCCGYDVKTDRTCTVGEFVKEVLETHSNEWGDFSVLHEGDGWLDRFFKVDYKYGQLQYELPEDIAQRCVVEIKANGGWSLMSYSIKVK